MNLNNAPFVHIYSLVFVVALNHVLYFDPVDLKVSLD